MFPNLSNLSIDAKRDEGMGDSNGNRSAKVARVDSLGAYEAWLRTASDNETAQGIKRAIEQCRVQFVPLGDGYVNARELGITRVLQANAVIRARFGVEPFFPTNASVSYVCVSSDATLVDTSLAATSSVTFVRSWMDQPTSRHAMTLLRETDGGNGNEAPSLYLVDSNGAKGSHAVRLEGLKHAPYPIKVLETLPVQTGVQNTDLWKRGQVLGKFMGWCSLWTMCLCELVAVGGLSVASAKLLMSPQNEEEMERLLVVVRESTIRTFHHAVQWLDRNGHTKSLQFKLLNPLKSTLATQTRPSALKSMAILGQTLAVEIVEDHVLIGACKKRRSMDFKENGYNVFMCWEIMNGPLLFTIGLPVALNDLKVVISKIRSAIETYFDTTLPPFYARGESGKRIWILEDYAVHVPVVLKPESRAALDVRTKLEAKLRGQYKETAVPWLNKSGIRLRTNELLNVDADGRQFVFKDIDFGTVKLDDAQKQKNVDPEIKYKSYLDEAFPLWKRKAAREISEDDMAIRIIVKNNTNGSEKKPKFSFGIGRDFDESDVALLVESIQRLRSMDDVTTALQNVNTQRSLVIEVATKNGTRRVQQVHNAFSEWRWDATTGLLFRTIEGLRDA
jgi:hypothetical protein